MIGYARNINALMVTRLQGETSSQLGGYYDQLSSGLRINKASVDPAGLAVSSKLVADSRVSNRARLNVEDGVSFMSIADAAYQAASEVLTRMGELANQSASGAISAAQRSALSTEFEALKQEITRIQGSTVFNGQKIAQGDLVARDPLPFSVGLFNGEPFVSADGRYVTYMTGSDVYQRDLETGVTTTVITGAGVISGGVATSAFGDKVAYTNGTRIYLWDRLTNTTNTIVTLTSGWVNDLAVSNDGSKVAFLSEDYYDDDGSYIGTFGAEFGLTVYDTSTNSLRGDGGVMTFVDPLGTLGFSPDGSRIFVGAFDNSIGDSGTGVYHTDALIDGAEIFDPSAQGQAFIGSDNNLYYIAFGGGSNNLLRSTTTTSGQNVSLISSGVGIQFGWGTDGGNSLTFFSTADILGTNSSGIRQAYKVSISGEIRQLTNYTSNVLSNIWNVSGDGYTVLNYSGTTNYRIDIRPEVSLGIETGSGTTGRVTGEVLGLDAAIRGLGFLDISSQRSSRVAADVIEDNTGRLAVGRGKVAAGLSRLSSARNLLIATTENLAAATSRIRDVDIADAVAQSTKLRVLADTQSALLGQASRIVPEIALELLESAAQDK